MESQGTSIFESQNFNRQLNNTVKEGDSEELKKQENETKDLKSELDLLKRRIER